MCYCPTTSEVAIATNTSFSLAYSNNAPTATHPTGDTLAELQTAFPECPDVAGSLQRIMAFIAKVSTVVASGHFGSAETKLLMESATVFLQPFLEIQSTLPVVPSSIPPSGSEWQRMKAEGPVVGKSAYPPAEPEKDIEIVR